MRPRKRGGTFSVTTTRKRRVAVPSAFFKLVYDPGTGKSWAHIQDNHPDTRVTPPVSYEKFIERTGLNLLTP